MGTEGAKLLDKTAKNSRLNSQVNGPCMIKPLESPRTPKEQNLSGNQTEAHAGYLCVCFLLPTVLSTQYLLVHR